MAKKNEKKEISFNSPTRFIFGGRHYSILTVITMPEQLYSGFLSNINNVRGVKVSIKHIPVALENLKNQIAEEINDLKNALANDKSSIAQQNYRDDIESLTQYYNDIMEYQPRVFNFQMHLIVSGETEDELNDILNQTHAKLSSMDVKAIPMMFEQASILQCCVPVFPPQDIEKRLGNLIPSYSLATMYPFVFDCLKDNGCGTILGTDYSGGIVLFNQYLYLEEQEAGRNNANMIIIGGEKSGKTSTAKILLRTDLRNNHNCYYIDPEGTKLDFTVSIGGDNIRFGKGSHLINPLEIVNDADANEVTQGLGYTVLTRAISHFKAFMLYLEPSLNQNTLSMLDKVLTETYTRFNITTNTNFASLSSDSYPTIDDLYATVRGKLISLTQATEERNALDLLEHTLRPFTESLKGYFNGHTKLDIYSNYANFDYSLIQDDKLKKALMFNTIRFCWSKCLKEGIKSIYIDNFEELVNPQNPYGLAFISQMLRKSAKYSTGITILYKPNRFFVDNNLANEFKTILQNTSYYIIHNVKKNNLDYIGKWISLNDREKENIKYYQAGEGLFICGKRRMNIEIKLTNDELSEINTQ